MGEHIGWLEGWILGMGSCGGLEAGPKGWAQEVGSRGGLKEGLGPIGGLQ